MNIRAACRRVRSVGVGFLALLLLAGNSAADIQRAWFKSDAGFLTLEFLRDDLIHFEWSATAPAGDAAIPTTPQVAKTDYAGPTALTRSGPGDAVLETAAVQVSVDPAKLCLTVTDTAKRLELSVVCPLSLVRSTKGFTLASPAMQNVYGLGEQFVGPTGSPDGDWTAPRWQVRTPGDEFGNQLTNFNGGVVGNAQFPVMYAVGAAANYALFIDQFDRQRWDFSGKLWKLETAGDAVRGYFVAGPDLPHLRGLYMELTGRPPVPPKKMFGLWLSEFGYDDWKEVDAKLTALRADRFPIDGFVLDLQWFGGVPFSGAKASRMGSLGWDTSRFPAPRERMARYRDEEGIAFMMIEESYVDERLPEYIDLKARGFLVRRGCPTCEPVALGSNWWGSGSMLDWTLEAAADYWHDTKRAALVKDGTIGHWIDLGEPENYDRRDWVAGVLPGKHQHADYHNAYNFTWAQGIARGYARNAETRRPFILSRSGTAGIQRFGTAMWSGDIASDLDSLAAHLNVQMHMSMSGIDYFGADIGGYHRQTAPANLLDTIYTQWFADGMAFDVPGRPHAQNVCNCRETAPNRIGDKASNLANLRQRYELSPYLYSLAHRAHLAGEPVVPPLVYYFQDDPKVRRLGGEKLLGRDLLVAAVADRRAPKQIDVYLPAGDWVDYHGNQWLRSSGQVFAGQPLLRDGVFRLPVYARAGAIIPKMFVDDQTLNVTGRRSDGSVRNELILRVYASKAASNFTLYEDDGETIAYQSGAVRRTLLAQQLATDGQAATVTIAAAAGTYAGAPDSRDNVVELVTDGLSARVVTLDATPLPRRTSRAEFDAAPTGWLNAGANLIVAKAGPRPVSQEKLFRFELGAP